MNDPAADMASTPFHWRSAFRDGAGDAKMWCLQCCNNNRLSMEMNSTWELNCDYNDEQKVACGNTMPVGAPDNFRNYEFRFNHNPKKGGAADAMRDQVRCPLERVGGVVLQP